MRKYKFVISDTGHERVYKSLPMCMYQGMRCLKSLMRRGLIFGIPEIEFYKIEDGLTSFVNRLSLGE